MEHTLTDKVAIVTGAGSGIGKASALKLAQSGAKVGLIDLKEDNVKEVRQQIEEAGSEAVIAEADVSDPEAIEAAIQKVISRWDRLDFVFVNAGMNGKLSPIEDFDPEDWDATITNNLKSTFLTVKYAIPHMKESGGSIVITSSVNGNRIFSNFGMSAYSASKAGQMAFGKMAALELSNYGIRVNVICPGAIETNIGENTDPDKDKLEKVKIPVEYPEGDHPLEAKPGTPEEVADLVHFFASDASRHISGTEMYIDGAESLLR